MTNLLGQFRKLVTVSASGNLSPGHNSLNATGGALTGTLPAITGSGSVAQLVAAGKPVRVKVSKSKSDTSTNAVTVACASGETFEGGSSSVQLLAAGEKLTLSAEILPGSTTPVWVTEEHTLPRDTADGRYSRPTRLMERPVGVSEVPYNVMNFGAKGDWQSVPDGAITANAISTPSYSFTAADVGKYVKVFGNNTGAGNGSNHIVGTITSVSGGVATISGAGASTARNGVRVDWASDDGPAIQAAINAAMAADSLTGTGLARVVVLDPNVPMWWTSVPIVVGTSNAVGMPVTLRGGSANGAQLPGTNLNPRQLLGQSTIQRANSRATHDLIQVYGHGFTLEGVCLDGQMSGSPTSYLLNVTFGFEMRIRHCRFIRSYYTALWLQTVNNCLIEDIHVNYCGNGRAYPAVKFTATADSNSPSGVDTSNTIQCVNWHCEFNSGVDIDIAGSNSAADYAEFVLFVNLHVEGTLAAYYNLLGVTYKNVPCIVIGSARGIEFSNSFIYARNSTCVEVKSQNTFPTEYSVSFVNTHLLGDPNPVNGSVTGTDHLVDVITMTRGTVQFVGCKFTCAATAFVIIDSGYTGRYVSSGNAYGENIAPIPANRVVDNRSASQPRSHDNLTTDRDIGTTDTGHIVSSFAIPVAERPTIARGAGGGTGTSAPAPAISGSDTAGIVTWGTGTSPSNNNPMFLVTLARPLPTSSAARVVVTPANLATAQLGVPYIGGTATGWALYLATAPAASLSNLQYHYVVVGSVP